MSEETDFAAKGYIITFNMEINFLKKSLTGYRSIILRIKQSGVDLNKPKDVEKMDEELRNGLFNWSDNVRDNVESSFISYNALIGTIANLKSEKLEGYYKNIKEIFSPQLEDVENYTLEIHKCFVKSTLYELLTKINITYETKLGQEQTINRDDIHTNY